MPKQLGPRDYAILRNVWTLTDEERSWCSYLRTYRVTRAQLDALLAFSDRVFYQQDFWDAYCVSDEWAGQNLIQFRRVGTYRFALIKAVPSGWSEQTIRTCEEYK
jgi:hypothetical protein